MTDKLEEDVLNKRKAARQAESKAAMREKISFTKTLKSIDEAEEKLLEMITTPDLSSAHVGAVNALLGSKWKKLNKLLPDVKAIEITGEDGKELYSGITVTVVKPDAT